VPHPKTVTALRRQRHRDDGSAIAEFVMVTALLLLLGLGVFQLAFALHVRVTLIDCAAEGARVAAGIGSDLELGKQRAKTLIAGALNPDYAADVTAEKVQIEGIDLVRVTVNAPLPLIGLFGPVEGISITGHAVDEASL